MSTLPSKALTIFGSVLLIGGIAVGGAAAPAFAHTPEMTPLCDSLSMEFTRYTVIAAQPATGGKPAVAADNTPNTVTVTIDGVASAPEKFGRSYSSTIPLDGQKPHTYSVVLGTHDGYDRSFAGKTVACPPTKPVTPPTTPSEPPVTPPTTPSEPPVTPPTTPSVPPVVVPPVTETPAPVVPTVTETPAPIVPDVPVATATPAVVTAPTPTASTTELAETGVSSWSVPAVGASVLAMLLGAGLLLARRFRRA